MVAHERPHRPKRPRGQWFALALAIAVNVVFLAILVFSVSWTNRKPEAVTAELYAPAPTGPSTASPPKAEPPPKTEPPPPAPEPPKAEPPPPPKPEPPPPKPEPPPPKPEPKPPLAEKPDQRPVDVAQKLKAEAERKKQEQQKREQERLAEQKRAQEKAAAEQKRAQEKVAEQKRQEDKRQADMRDAMKREAERETQSRQQAEREKQLRDAANRELQDRQRAAAQQASEAAGRRAVTDWTDRIRAKVRSNVIEPGDMPGNPECIFEVTLLPSYEVLDVRLKKSSGVRAYDDAVQRAILKSSPLPRPDRADVFQRVLELRVRPRD